MSAIGCLVLTLIGLSLCAAGIGLVIVDRSLGGKASWIPWLWVIAGAWIVFVAVSGVAALLGH